MTRRAAITLTLAVLVALAALGGRTKTVEAQSVVIDDAANLITFTDLQVGDRVVFEARLTNTGGTKLDGLMGAVFLRALPGEFAVDDFTCEWSALGYRPCDHIWKPTNHPGYEAEMIIGPGVLSLSPSASIFTLVRITANVDHAKVEAKVAIIQDTGTVTAHYDASDEIVSEDDSPIRLDLTSQGQAAGGAQDTQRTVNLSPGCGMATLTFADDTEATALTTAVSPASALQTVWRLDNATGTFEAFVPQAPQASDLTSLNLLDAVYICVDAAASIAMPAVSPDPSGTPTSTDLATRCNTVGLTFPDGAAPSQVADAVTPPGTFKSMWRLDNATGTFEAYVAAAPQASDLTSLRFLDAVFICTQEPAILDLPAITEPGPGAVTGPPRDIRFVMEAAVPQVVDLPQGFVAIDEEFESFFPPGPLYAYQISYGSVLEYEMKTPVYAAFDLEIFDKVKDARSFMNEITSVSADELRAELEPVFGGSLGLEISSLTIQEIEDLAAIGEEAHFARLRILIRPVGSTEVFLPMAFDAMTIRRDRVVGQVWIGWSLGPPGSKVMAENLAKKMDAGIQEALPEFLAAVP